MTREIQKEKERCHAETFFRSFFPGDGPGFVVNSCDPPVPDILVHGPRLSEIENAGADGVHVEVREYHPDGGRRVEVQSRWQNELLPMIESARRANPGITDSCAEVATFVNIRG